MQQQSHLAATTQQRSGCECTAAGNSPAAAVPAAAPSASLAVLIRVVLLQKDSAAPAAQLDTAASAAVAAARCTFMCRLLSAACCRWPSACSATQQSSTSPPSWHTCRRPSQRCAHALQEVGAGRAAEWSALAALPSMLKGRRGRGTRAVQQPMLCCAAIAPPQGCWGKQWLQEALLMQHCPTAAPCPASAAPCL